MPPKKNYDLHRNNKKQFVEAAIHLLAEEQPENISIRRIAREAGFHNSTIYSYFRDAEWLLALASVYYLKDYRADLAELSRRQSSPYESFFDIWGSFCENAFANPALYHNFFFGRYRNELRELLEEYYELMPEEKSSYTPDISRMFFGTSLSDRCLSILEPLSGSQGTRVTAENLETINYLILESFHGFLDSLVQGNDLYETATPSAYIRLLHFLIDK